MRATRRANLLYDFEIGDRYLQSHHPLARFDNCQFRSKNIITTDHLASALVNLGYLKYNGYGVFEVLKPLPDEFEIADIMIKDPSEAQYFKAVSKVNDKEALKFLGRRNVRMIMNHGGIFVVLSSLYIAAMLYFY